MNIIYNLKGIKDYQDLYWEGSLGEDTLAVIEIAALVGMPRITLGNYLEFWARCEVLSRYREGLMPYIYLKEVKRHIGLETNSESLGKAAFLDLILGEILSDLKGATAPVSEI